MWNSNRIKPIEVIKVVIKHAERNRLEFILKTILPAVYEVQYPTCLRDEFPDIEAILTQEIAAQLDLLRERISASSIPFLRHAKPCEVFGGKFTIRFVAAPEDVRGVPDGIVVRHRLKPDETELAGAGTTWVDEDSIVLSSPDLAIPALSPAPLDPVLAYLETSGSEPIEMRQREVTVGCGLDADVRVTGRGISHQHLKVRLPLSAQRLEACEVSKNWTMIQGKLLDKNVWTPIEDDSTLDLAGAVKLRIRRAA